MKRAGRLLERIEEPGNLLDAYLKARRRKQDKPEVRRFTERLDEELESLRTDLRLGRCRCERYTSFRIYDPKERLIHAAPFRDRVLHHAVMNVCEPYFERFQIFDSYACRKGKGTRAAVFRARDFARRHPCYLKLDVRKYFHSVTHECLKNQLAGLFKDPRLLALLETIIDGSPLGPNYGLPIGNLTSQYFANHYLASMDPFIKQRLRAPGYVRYMDDFVLWGESTSQLMRWERDVRRFCAENLNLELKTPCVNRSVAGLPFLGFLVLPGQLRLTSRTCRRMRRKLKACQRKLEHGLIDQQCAAVIVHSLLARTDWAGGASVRRRLMADDFGRRPKAATASSGAVAGLTTPATAGVPTATGGTRATATTTRVSGSCLPQAQGNGRMSSVEPGDDPVPAVAKPSRDEVRDGDRVLVGRVDARLERPRSPFLFPEMEDDRMNR
jgi:RNA-directed DNA polymerase